MLSKLYELRNDAKTLLKKAKQDTFCSKRIELDKIEDLARVWEATEIEHRYLEGVLLHEYLEKNIELTPEQRKVAKDCVRLVGDFYEVAAGEHIFTNRASEIEQKTTKKVRKEVIKYRRD